MKVLKKHRTKIKFIAYAVFLMMSVLIGRMTYVVVFRGEELTVKATELHERERAIKAGRGRIISSDGTVLATNETVCTVSVIHSQIKDPERVISILSEELDMDEEKVRKYVEKFSSMEKIKSNVPKEAMNLQVLRLMRTAKGFTLIQSSPQKSSVLPGPIIREYWDWR